MPPEKKALKSVAKKKPIPSFGLQRKPTKSSEALSRRTITIRPDTERTIDALVGPRKFSAFVQTALDNELQRERIDEWLAEQEAARGGKPLSPEALEFAERAWQRRK
jgi:post-segregation antitoxin (ccd killing protein)